MTNILEDVFTGIGEGSQRDEGLRQKKALSSRTNDLHDDLIVDLGGADEDVCQLESKALAMSLLVWSSFRGLGASDRRRRHRFVKLRPMSDLQVLRVTTMSEMAEALYVRRIVFTEEQGIDADVEVDEHDGDPSTIQTAVHVLARLDGRPVATARILLGDSTEVEAHIGRVAVLDIHRGKNFGRAVMETLQDIARDLGYSEIVLGAEATAAGFYERLGHVCESEPYMHVGILHQDMRLKL